VGSLNFTGTPLEPARKCAVHGAGVYGITRPRAVAPNKAKRGICLLYAVRTKIPDWRPGLA
jgi:hypothetical protein